MPSMHEESLLDAQLGISQIPLLKNSKRAAIRWKEFTERLPTEEELRDWFATGRFNRGIVTGAISGIVGVDLDDVDRGFAFLRERGVPLPVMQTRTWSGKHHLLFRHPGPRVAPAVKVCGEPVDIRGDDSYLVAAGSSIDGKFYERLGVWDKDAIPVFRPEWFQEKTMNDRPRPPSSSLVSTKIESVRKYIAHIVAVAGQRGHSSCFRAACKRADAGLTLDEIMTELRFWNERNALPMFSESELLHKALDSLKRK